MKCSPAFLALFSLCLLPFPAATARAAGKGQSECVVDTVALGDAEVKAYRDRSGLRHGAGGTLTWDMKMLENLPKIMGNADPVHYMQMMPGVQTSGEYRCGINIQGCDNGHNMVSVGGIPLYNVNHLLGFFSTFNATHYTDMRLERTPSAGASPNRVGGSVDFAPPSAVSDSISGEVSVGIISSQGTLSVPLGRRRNMSLRLSGRASYVNLLYGGWLADGYKRVDYKFHDLNLTWVAKPAKCHTLTANLYYGSDKGGLDEKMYGAFMAARWGNMAAGLRWLYENGGWKATQHVWVTAYRNSFRLDMQDYRYKMPSGIGSMAYSGEFSRGRWRMGAELAGHRIERQRLILPGDGGGDGNPRARKACEAAVFAEFRQPIVPVLHLNLGLRGSIFGSGGRTFGAADPSAALVYEKGAVRCDLSYALRHQYLHLTGITDAGLPIEYWMESDGNHPPQHAHSFAANAAFRLLQGRYRADVGVFCKLLHHQMEYNGSILDCMGSNYDPERYLFTGRGRNYGLSLMLTKCAGRLTGWVSYAYTSARRRFYMGGSSRKSPASHERPHELDAVLSYTLSPRWSFGANIVYASGTPFTAPVAIVLLNGCVVTQYGAHNANRLHPYFRTDVSVNYKWRGKGRTEQGMNLSVYNVTFRKNDLFYSVHTYQDGSFAYRPTTFFLRALPSVSYFLHF